MRKMILLVGLLLLTATASRAQDTPGAEVSASYSFLRFGVSHGVNQNGANVDAIEGISSYEGVNNVDVENNVLKNFSYAGFDFYNYFNSGGATSGNTIRGMASSTKESTPSKV